MSDFVIFGKNNHFLNSKILNLVHFQGDQNWHFQKVRHGLQWAILGRKIEFSANFWFEIGNF